MNEEKYKSSWTKYEKTRDLLSGIDPVEAAFLAGWNAASTTEVVTTTCSHITAETIYNAYPRKVGKQAALKAIDRAIRTLFIEHAAHESDAREVLLSKTKAYASAVAKWPEEDKRFIPHPATWFNEGRYDDDPKEWIRGSTPSNGRVSTSNIKFVE